MIFVTLGSQKFPFDRLLAELDRLIEAGVITEPVFAQTGCSTYAPKHFTAAPMRPSILLQSRFWIGTPSPPKCWRRTR